MGTRLFYTNRVSLVLALGFITIGSVALAPRAVAQERYAAIDPDAVAPEQQQYADAPASLEATPEDEGSAASQPATAAPEKVAESKRIDKKAQKRMKVRSEEEVTRNVSSSEETSTVDAPTRVVAETNLRSGELRQHKVQYDALPQDQREAFLDRMELARRILLKSGRVYDYRVTTLKELRAIAKSLNIAEL